MAQSSASRSLFDWLNKHQEHELRYLGPDAGDPAVGMAGHGPDLHCQDCDESTPDADEQWWGAPNTRFDEAAHEVHRAFCYPDEEVGEWDRQMADALHRNGYSIVRRPHPSRDTSEPTPTYADAFADGWNAAGGERWPSESSQQEQSDD